MLAILWFNEIIMVAVQSVNEGAHNHGIHIEWGCLLMAWGAGKAGAAEGPGDGEGRGHPQSWSCVHLSQPPGGLGMGPGASAS